MTTAESAGGTSRKPETTFDEMLNTVEDSLSDLLTFEDEQDREDEEDEEEDTELGKLSDDEPGWVMVTISKQVQHRKESFRQTQMGLDELTRPGWGDTTNYFYERDMMYRTAELNCPSPNRSDCCHTISNIIWRAYADS
jgi:hypothetical protein